jgi:LPXTG-motif cell wall-anchored protein
MPRPADLLRPASLRRASLRPTLVAALLTAVATTGVGWSTSAEAAPAPSVHAEQRFTTTAIEIETTVGPDDDVPCTVQADLYVPDGVDADHPAPAILTTNGFGGAKDDDGQSAGASAFAKAGYVVISYSGLGFGGSDCKIYLDDPDYDGKAGTQIVDVLAGEKAYTDLDDAKAQKTIDYVATDGPTDPRVGMIGGSYGGQIQFAVAGQDSRVDAIIPEITWNDLSYSLAPNNTDQSDGVSYGTPGVAKKQWIGLFFGIGIADGLQNTTTDPTRNVGCPNFTDQACSSAAQLQSLGYADDATLELARHASVASYLEKITVPTLLVQGQHDTLFNVQEAIATYRALRAQGTTVAMSWFSGGHSGDAVPGDLDLTGGVDASHQGRRWIDWMDRYVRGDESVSAGPEFEYFRDWIAYDGTAIDPAYASASSYTGAPTSTLYLSGTDKLTSSQATVAPGDAQLAVSPTPTSYSETSGVGEMLPSEPPPSDSPGTFAAYTTPVLTRDSVLVGAPRLTVRIKAPVAAASQGNGPGGKLILFAKLYDVAPDGTQKLQHRLISPVRIKDVNQPVDIELPAVAQRFPAGHRLRLVIAGGDAAYANNPVAQPVTIQTDAQRPGTLRLPLVESSTTGDCPAGTSGTQPFCTAPTGNTPGTGDGAGGTGTGGTGTGGTGTGGTDGTTVAAPGDTTTDTTTTDTTTTDTTTAGPTTSGPTAAELADTGASQLLVPGLALGLALIGTGLFLATRRRRATA